MPRRSWARPLCAWLNTLISEELSHPSAGVGRAADEDGAGRGHAAPGRRAGAAPFHLLDTLAEPLFNTLLQVWDERLMKTELGVATLRLADVLEQRRFKDRLRMGDAGELDIEARWLAIMAQNRT